MSYKSKKNKKGMVNQLRRKFGMIKIALFKKINYFTLQKQNKMQNQTRKMVQWLRERSKIMLDNNLKVNDWVGEYLEDCVLNGKPVEILTQCCISKGLEVRYANQGNQFIPTKNERKVFLEQVPAIIAEFKNNGMDVSWYLTFNRFWLDIGRIDVKIEQAFCLMIQSLLDEAGVSDVLVLNWEDDFLKRRSEPNLYVEQNVRSLVSAEAYARALKFYTEWVDWYRINKELQCSDEQIEKDLAFQFGCVAEEGRLLTSPESIFPDGRFLLIPLERPESYDFFDLLVPDFKNRIVSVLTPYPWRLE